jgi:hypothetical protein
MFSICRSAVLFYMCKFEECLEDIIRAESNEYDKRLLYKLYLREARCLKYLGRDYLECYKKAVNVRYIIALIIMLGIEIYFCNLQMAEKFNMNELPKLKELMKSEINQPAPIEDMKAGMYYTDGKVPPLSYGPSKEVPCFSSAVSVAYSEEFGRHLVANRNIKIGWYIVNFSEATLKSIELLIESGKISKYYVNRERF